LKGYELCLIFHPEASDQEIDNLLNSLNEIILKLKGQVIKTEKWGKKNLKFPIKKQIRGIYCFLCYMAEGKVLRDVERLIRFNESILRYNTVRLPEGLDAPDATPDHKAELDINAQITSAVPSPEMASPADQVSSNNEQNGTT